MNEENNKDYGYENSYVAPENTAPAAPVAPVMQTHPYVAPNAAPRQTNKNGKSVSLGILAVCIAVCLIMAGGVGFIGGVISGGLLDNVFQNDTGSSQTQLPSSSESVASIVKTPTGDEQSGLSVADIVEKTAKSVVAITTETMSTDSWLGNYVKSGAGSGVIIDENGYIVTCNHVIENAGTITVTLSDGVTSYEAKLIGSDAKTDLALLKIEATGLSAATFGNSDEIKVGSTAVVVGNPLGQYGGSVTSGIISALDRKVTIDGQVMTLLQTSAAINPGNSGGALFDDSGLLIGIVNSKSYNTSSGTIVEGIGFAIPSELVKTVVPDLTSYGYVKGRPSLGLSTLEISDSLTAMRYGVNYLGVYVLEASNGFAAGDLIVAIDDITSVSTLSAITSALDGYNIGDEVTVKVYRNRGYEQIKLTLTEYRPTGMFGE